MSAQMSRATNHIQANPKRVGGVWPTEKQLRLLRVALAERPDEAAAALAAWKPHLQIEQLDLGSQRLLPLCYLNLQRHSVDDPLLVRLKEFYVRARDRNHMIFAGVADLLRKLDEAGIRGMLFKGASMITNYYRDDGARYMDDCDMLIPTRQAAQTIAEMTRMDWHTSQWMPRRLTEDFFSNTHALGFTADKRLYVDIHWHALAERYWPGADDAFWEAAQPVRWHDAPNHVLNHADSLLISCINGTRWDYMPAIRWVTDSVTILRTVEVDWKRLEQQTERLRFARPIHAALSYLREMFGVVIPDDTLRRLAEMQVPWWAEQEYRIRTRPGQPWSHPTKMLVHHVRRHPERGLFGHLRAVPGTLAYLRIVQHLRGVIGAKLRSRARSHQAG